MKLTFAGAADTVTGSRYVLDGPSRRWLLDCGLFQGFKQLRERNWARFPVPPRSIDSVVLSHAHLDHSGYLPALVRDGFRGPVYATPATCDLAQIMLRDSAHLQEEEAAYANRHGFSKHRPALPLYTLRDAERALERLEPVRFGETVDLGDGVTLEFLPAGHLLGAAIVVLRRGGRSLVFSGDLGRSSDLLMKPPKQVREADTLLVESTYGNRKHTETDALERVGELVRKTAARGGIVLVPSFAIGRAQLLMYALYLLKEQGRIPDLPVFLDSPMARDATGLYRKYRSMHRLDVQATRGMCQVARIVNTPDESKALAQLRMPSVIIAASGMATGGRVLHHLKMLAPDPRNLVMFVGFQAGGTRGAHMVAGATEVKIHGQWVPVRAEVASIEGLSAHADGDEIVDWLRGFRSAPQQVFVVHGEPDASDRLRARIEDELHWRARVPQAMERVEVAL